MERIEPLGQSNICAIVCVRNELRYLRGLITHLRDQGVDIAFIDNASTDGSREFIESHLGTDVLSVRNLPYHGTFSLSDQLQAKAEVEQGLTHDWVMHVDADEIHHPSTDGLRLVDVANQADAAGFNAVNFEEFVFLPPTGQDLSYENAHLDITLYYYFAPTYQRLIRLYRRGHGLDNRAAGGHRLKGNPIIYPQNQVLRHYIGLDQTHLLKKYIGREFDAAELKKGWHGNRVGLTEKMLSLDRFDPEMFDYLPSSTSRAFFRNRPRRQHFWSLSDKDVSYNDGQQAAAQRAKNTSPAKQIKPPMADLAQNTIKIAALEAEIVTLKMRQKQRRVKLRTQITQLKAQNAAVQHDLNTIRQSKSWRMTAPLRKLAAMVRR